MKKTNCKITLIRLIFLLAIFPSALSAGENSKLRIPVESGTCLAVRGNGELMPAHWGGMASFIENFGFPVVMAGGSSATITAFWMESIRENTVIWATQKKDPQTAFLMASLLWKSLQSLPEVGLVHFMEWSQKSEFFEKTSKHQQVLSGLLAQTQPLETMQKALVNLEGASADHLQMWTRESNQNLLTIIQAYQGLPGARLFFGPAAQRLKLDAHLYEVELAKFGQSKPDWKSPTLQSALNNLALSAVQFRESIHTLGKFDAVNDPNLFFREGLANFDELSEIAGLVADYLSQNGADEKSDAAMASFLKTCAPNSKQKTWSQINLDSKDLCRKLALESWTTFLVSIKRIEVPSIDQVVGARQPVLISTSIIIGKSAQKLAEEFPRIYGSPLALPLEKDFFPLPTSDLRFGYWGSPVTLAAVQNAMATKSLPSTSNTADTKFLEQIFDNDKSRRFSALPATTWRDAISLSPAEPGLSPILPLQMSVNDEAVFSAGGWSDLHPTLVLKMLPECERIVYLTRKGEDSEFAVNIRRRLLGNQTENRFGADISAQQKPESALDISLKVADQVICTDWNDFSVVNEFQDLIENSYQAPILGPLKEKANPTQAKISGCTL